MMCFLGQEARSAVSSTRGFFLRDAAVGLSVLSICAKKGLASLIWRLTMAPSKIIVRSHLLTVLGAPSWAYFTFGVLLGIVLAFVALLWLWILPLILNGS